MNDPDINDPDNPDFDLQAWAEAQWDNFPDIERDLTFGYNVKGDLGQFDYCIAYFSYWKFKIDMTLEPETPKFYPVELTISIDPDGDGQ